MKTMILTLTSLLLLSWPVPAQSQSPSPELSPSEQQRYGDRLWEVPREPYQSGYKFEEYNSNLYQAPDPVPARPESSRPGGRVQGDSPINTTPSVGRSPTRAQERFQTRERFQNEQRKISERSRVTVPKAPLQVNPAQPAGSQPLKP